MTLLDMDQLCSESRRAAIRVSAGDERSYTWSSRDKERIFLACILARGIKHMA